MKTRRWYILLLILTAAVSPDTTTAQDSPPDSLHREGDYWTAWTPPAPPEDAQIYIIEAGDTLWNLAKQFLGDPHLWPQIWEQNQYILDSHWIYPGDPLILTGAASASAFVDPQDVVAPPLDEAAPFDAGGTITEDDTASSLTPSDLGIASPPVTAPVPLGYESDIYCSAYIGAMEEEFPFSIGSSEYDHLSPQLDLQRNSNLTGDFGKAETEKYGLGLGDIVYLENGRADGLAPGELLTAIQPRKPLHHPEGGRLLGRVYAYLGRVRVLSVQEETSIAEIVHLCSPIPVGSLLKHFEPEPVPLRRITPLRPLNYPAAPEALEGAPTIITSVDSLVTDVGLVTLGAGYLVVIDQGSMHDTVPGDIYTIYRRNREGFPPIVLGELGILSVFEETSLARILRSRYAIYVGDPLQLK